jgi:hypothetical protein
MMPAPGPTKKRSKIPIPDAWKADIDRGRQCEQMIKRAKLADTITSWYEPESCRDMVMTMTGRHDSNDEIEILAMALKGTLMKAANDFKILLENGLETWSPMPNQTKAFNKLRALSNTYVNNNHVTTARLLASELECRDLLTKTGVVVQSYNELFVTRAMCQLMMDTVKEFECIVAAIVQ